MGRFCSLLTKSTIFGITIIGILVFPCLHGHRNLPAQTLLRRSAFLRHRKMPIRLNWNNKVTSIRAQKAYLDSIDYYRAAMKTADSAILHNKVGMCLLQLRRDSEAKKEFQRAIKENKEYAEAYNNLGALYYNLRKYGAAIKEYKKAIKLNDDSASFHSNLGGAYFSQKDFDRASREYQRAIQIDPEIFQRQSSASAISIRLVGSNDLGHFHYVMAQMYGQHGDLDHCRFYLSKANEEGYPDQRRSA